MDIKSLIRDPSKIEEDLQVLPDGKIATTNGCKIYVPARWAERNFANIGNDVTILGLFAIVIEDKYYGVCSVNSMVSVKPTEIEMAFFGDDKYIELVFEPGDLVIRNTALVCDKQLVYYIYDEIQAKGYVPWYINYIDLAELLSTAEEYTGINLNTNKAILDMIAAVMARDPKDRQKFFRQSINSAEELVSKRPDFIALRNIQMQASNTVSKLMGSYWTDAAVSALVNPATRVEGIETVVRV